MNEPLVEAASGRVIGKTCPHCNDPITSGDPVLSCAACLCPQHAACWRSGGELCASYFCAKETSRSIEKADIVISFEDTQRPAPTPRALPRRVSASPVPIKNDPLANTALGLGLLSIPLIGCAFGPVAVLLGVMSIGRIGASGQLKGRGRAIAGVFCGLFATLAWIGGLGYYTYEHGAVGRAGPNPFLTAEEAPSPPTAAELADIPVHIRRALKANVFIQGQSGYSKWIGSGIVVSATNDQIRVLTNRHVAEGNSPGSSPKLTIRTINGDEINATILWRAEHSDVALLTGSLLGAEEKVSVAYTESSNKNPSIGSKVFAIGNPHNLGWSFTDGVVSRLPRHTQPDRTVTFIQTTTPINPGNSGGALYNERGYLVGMNTWKISQTIGEGLGFAISVSSLIAERGDLLQVKKYKEDPEKKDKKAE